MPTPKHGYSVNGQKVPSVTTVIGRYKDSGGLLRWTWKCGKDGLCFKKEGRNAANIGTAVHDAIERQIKGEPQVPNPTEHYELPPGGMDKARRCFDAWKIWNDAVRPVYLHIEPQLVHSELLYGGTIDAVGMVNGKSCLIDWKTSNDIYNEVSMQLAAYAKLWEHNTGERIDTAYVLRMDKKTGKFEQFKLHGLEPYFQHFLKLLDIYNEEEALFPAPWEKTTQSKLLQW